MENNENSPVRQVALQAHQPEQKPESENWQSGPVLVVWDEEILDVTAITAGHVIPLVVCEPPVASEREQDNERRH